MRQTRDSQLTRPQPGIPTGPRIQYLLDAEARPEYRQDAPALEIQTSRNGGGITSYHFFKWTNDLSGI